MKATSPPNTALVSDYSLDEVHRVINIKFPERANDLELFMYHTLFTVKLVITPTGDLEEESVGETSLPMT